MQVLSGKIEAAQTSASTLAEPSQNLLLRSKYMVATHFSISFTSHPTIHNFSDLTGLIFGRFTVLGYAGKGQWHCLCWCGETRRCQSGHLNSGHSQSCGCLKSYKAAERLKTHGKSKSTEYKSYCHAMGRCNNEKNQDYSDYGGRGIEFRFESFEKFIAEIGRKPTMKHSIDRINNDGHYETGNVKWSTAKEQSRNRRSGRILIIGNESKTIAEWSEIHAINQIRAAKRLKYGWCMDCVFRSELRRCVHK